VPFPNVPAMKQISVGGGFVLALTTEGRVWLWGKLAYGGVYYDDPVLAPAEVPGLSDVAAVVATQVAAVLKKDGTVWVWGNNEQAQFGNGKRDVGDRSRVPVRVPGVGRRECHGAERRQQRAALSGSFEGREPAGMGKLRLGADRQRPDRGRTGDPSDSEDRRGEDGVRGGELFECDSQRWLALDLGAGLCVRARMADAEQCAGADSFADSGGDC